MPRGVLSGAVGSCFDIHILSAAGDGANLGVQAGLAMSENCGTILLLAQFRSD